MRLNLALTESEEMVKKAALDFIKRDTPKLVIQSLQNSPTGYTKELWDKVVKMGWLGIIIPEQYGGSGSSLTTAGVLYEALGTGPLPGPYFSSGILSALVIMEAGSEQHKQSTLPNIANGKQLFALALTEPEYSWEPEAVQTTAVKEGNSIILNGIKLFVMDAQAATDLIVVARDGKSTGPDGISMFIVNCKNPGISIRQVPGMLAGRSFEIKLDSVSIPLSNVLGPWNGGWQLLKKAIDKAIPVFSAYQVGASQALTDMTIEYSQTREQFGQKIGRFQYVADMIIEMANRLEAARWTTYEALWKLDTQRPASESIHVAKAIASESYWEITTLAHRVFSGISYSVEHPVSFHTRASRYLYNVLGDPAYHRYQLAKLIIT